MDPVNEQPRLHTMVKEAASSVEARHLLLHTPNGPSHATLQQFASGVVTDIGTGTEYEMNQKADSVMQEWARPGFRFPRKDEQVFESLGRTTTLARLMGHSEVYDPEKYRDVRTGNLTGAVSLADWPGRHGKNGGGYHYAFAGTKIIASPTLPPGHGINLAPSREEFVSTMRQIISLQKTVGLVTEFVLG